MPKGLEGERRMNAWSFEGHVPGSGREWGYQRVDILVENSFYHPPDPLPGQEVAFCERNPLSSTSKDVHIPALIARGVLVSW